YKETLERMRKVSLEWSSRIKDTGFIPEADMAERAGNMPVYDYMRSGEINLDHIINASNTAITASPENIEALKLLLEDDESAVRYWGATGLLILKEKAEPAKQDLIK